MGQIHQKGSLSAKHEAKRGRGANPAAALPERARNAKEVLADEIKLHVRRRALPPAEVARIIKESPTRTALLLAGKLYSFSERQLGKIRDLLAE